MRVDLISASASISFFKGLEEGDTGSLAYAFALSRSGILRGNFLLSEGVRLKRPQAVSLLVLPTYTSKQRKSFTLLGLLTGAYVLGRF